MPTHENFAAYLREERGKRGLTQKQAAEELGVSLRTYATWERDETPPPDYRQQQVLQLWARSARDEQCVMIPALASLAAARPSAFDRADDELDYWPVDRSVLARLHVEPHQVRWVTLVGDSMEPTLRAGQRVLCIRHEGQQLIDRAIYVMLLRHMIVIKRIYIGIRSITLRGDADAQGLEVTLEEAEDITVLARVAYTGVYL